LTTIYNLVK